MPTRADVRRLSSAYRDVRTLARRDLDRLWDTLDTDDPMAVREVLEDVLPDLTNAYGEISATVAADFYEEMREAAGVGGQFTPVLEDPYPEEAVRANARWAIAPLFAATRDPSGSLSRLAGEVDRMSLHPGRQTIAKSVGRDPSKPRWARVPQGPTTCAWCISLASRGAIYRSQETAGGTAWHRDCDCTPTPIWPSQPYPEGYDPDALFEVYSDARAQAGSGGLKSILSSMREMQGIH